MASSLNTIINGAPFITRIQTASEELALDALISEEHSLENKVTEHPVEQGAAIVDHISNQPRELTVEGFITNSPVQFLGGRAGNLVRGIITPGDKVLGSNLNFADLAFQFIEGLHGARQLVTIIGKYKKYVNMAMISGTIPRDRSTGHALRFTLHFREVRRVELRGVLAPAKRTKSGSAQPVKDKGKTTTTTAPAPTEARSSFLFNLLN